MSMKSLSLFSLYCSSKELVNQRNLASHISFCHPLQLSFPDHIHGLISSQRSPCRFKRKETHPKLCQPFDTAMILLNQIIEVFDLSQLAAFGKMPFRFQFSKGFVTGGEVEAAISDCLLHDLFEGRDTDLLWCFSP